MIDQRLQLGRRADLQTSKVSGDLRGLYERQAERVQIDHGLYIVRGMRGTREEEVALPYWAPQPRALILCLTLPALTGNTHAAYEKIARTPADQPIVCVAARATIDQDQLRDIRLALGGIGEKPIVIAQPAGSIDDLTQLALSAITPVDDYFATARYRREMIGVLTKRVLSVLLHQPQ